LFSTKPKNPMRRIAVKTKPRPRTKFPPSFSFQWGIVSLGLLLCNDARHKVQVELE
jgi:hypothetical protein